MMQSAIAAATLGLSFAIYWVVLRPRDFHPRAPPKAYALYPVVGAIEYFSRPWTLFQTELQRLHAGKLDSKSALANPFGAYSLNLGKFLGVTFSGSQGREFMYTCPDFHFAKGYMMLFGAVVDVSNVKEADSDRAEVDEAVTEPNLKSLKRLLASEYMQRNLPVLLRDTDRELEKLGQSGITDPFESIYRLVFLLTIRTVAATELAEDEKLREFTLQRFEGVERGMAASAMLFPWLPTPASITKTTSAARLYMTIRSITQKREKEGRREDDAVQYLLDQGDSLVQIISFVLTSLLAGQLNSGINAAWLLIWLGASPEWLKKVKAEIESVAAKYGAPGQTLREQLFAIPLRAWENEFPIIDVCLKESIRLTMNGFALRYNDKRDVQIGEYIVPKDYFVMYSVTDIHHDPAVYPNPQVWDPERFMPERQEDQRAKFGFVGWGVGRHPCLGMRFAKMEINIILSFWIAHFDWDSIAYQDRKNPTAQGLTLDRVPQISKEAHSAKKPPLQERAFLRYRKRVDADGEEKF